MSRTSAARNEMRSAYQAAERDSLEQDFLRDQLEALLASPTLARVADRHSEGHDDPADFDRAAKREEDHESERDTVPSIETLLLREALLVRLK